jgi:asparagine synthetase B (glutamine-hydrolysing)
MSTVRVLGKLDATFAWDGARLYGETDLAAGLEPPSTLRGAAGTAVPDADGRTWRVVRDPLGLNKLFWAGRPDGGIDLAARPWTLVEHGRELDEIVAVPRGSVLDLDPAQHEPPATSLVPEAWSAAPSPGEVGAKEGREIRELLDRYLAAIAARHPGAPAFVCLSGGLDSTGIAVLVAEHFPEAVAVSFDLALGRGVASEDRQTAIRLARDLGLPLLEATVTADELLEPLDTVLREGIDWRDFNVHAALVNAAMAAAIDGAATGAGERPLVFTGDLANEFLIDYEAERYRGATYYPLPRLAPVALRSFLVRGLDSCHREVGIFEAWSMRLVQPYAAAVDTYMRLPEAFLRLPDRKERLCRAIFGEAIPDYVLSRPKARAQVGGSDQAGGVLATCVDRGLDATALRRRFADLHGGAEDSSLDRFIRAGRYRARAPHFEGQADERG